jgi:hypothetical protein
MGCIDDPHAQLVFYWLCSFRNSLSNLCCPSISTLSKKSCLSKITIIRALKYLIDLNILETKGEDGGRNKYTIKDNKNKRLSKNRCLIDTSASQTPPGVPQTLAIISNNNTNKNTTTNYPHPLSN